MHRLEVSDFSFTSSSSGSRVLLQSLVETEKDPLQDTVLLDACKLQGDAAGSASVSLGD